MNTLEDYKKAALSLYPEEWKEFSNGLRVDQNANVRAVAEDVFKLVFDTLRFDQDLSLGVASAFLRRIGDYAPSSQYDKCDASAKMATALEYAIIKIRDAK